ncbi:MAG: hypothetical protein IKQ46_05465 [Bacteroidales bacterium]|jgi:flavodoxin|nr:hypothetical protein [Bacteroidales bacterium]
MKKTVLTIAAAVALAGCGSQQAGNKSNEPYKSKSIVVYYSQTGATAKVADIFSQKLGIEKDSIVCEEPYNGDFNQTIERCQKDLQEGKVPAIKALAHNIAEFDTIYLGYPVWFGTFAPPVASFIKNVDLKGKVLVPFCTFGSGGLNTSSDQLKTQLPDAIVAEGYGVRNARVSKAAGEIETFLINSGALKGEKVVIPDFSESQPVTDEEKQIFDAACSNYQFPLGTPVTVGKRDVKNGVEYLFNVESQNQDGSKAQSKIYVIVENGSNPEFTQVVR